MKNAGRSITGEDTSKISLYANKEHLKIKTSNIHFSFQVEKQQCNADDLTSTSISIPDDEICVIQYEKNKGTAYLTENRTQTRTIYRGTVKTDTHLKAKFQTIRAGKNIHA